MNRRSLLQAGLAAGPVALAAKAGLLWPVTLLASDWPADAFQATSYQEATAALFGAAPVEEGGHVQLEAKAIVEDGSTAPIRVITDLAGPLTVTLFSVANPTRRWASSSSQRPWMAGWTPGSRWPSPAI